MFKKWKEKRDAKLEAKYLILKEKYERGCTFSDHHFSRFIDMELKYREIQDKKRSKLNVLSFPSAND